MLTFGKIIAPFFLILCGCTSDQAMEGDSREKQIHVDKSEIGWTATGEFISADRSLIQIFNDFDKPISFYPVISSREGEYKEDDVFYRKGVSRPFSGKVITLSDQKKLLSELIFYKGVPHGPHRKFFINGATASETIYDHGVMCGVHSKWWENGRLKELEYWSGGQYYGSKQWDKQGRLLRQIRLPMEISHVVRD